MASLPLGSTAKLIPADTTQRKSVEVVKGSSAYYKSTSDVSASSKDGTLTKGSALTISAGTYFVSAGESELFVTDLFDATGQDLATQAELDAAITAAEKEITNELTINPPSGETPLTINHGGAAMLTVQDISATAENRAPTIQYYGTNARWGSGIDISATPAYANFVPAFLVNYPAEGQVYDLIYCNARETKKEPTIGIATGTTYAETFRLAVQGSNSDEAPEKTLGTLLLKAGKEQTANVLEVIDYGGAKHGWYEPDSTTSNWVLKLRGDSTTANPIISVQDKTTDTPTFEVLANGQAKFGNNATATIEAQTLGLKLGGNLNVKTIFFINGDENAGLDRPEAGVLRVRSALKILGLVGFYNTAPAAKGTVTGSRGGNAALASLLEKLALTGLITNSSEA